MEDFVKSLLSTADLSVLTKKVVRKQYMVHTGKPSLTSEEKVLLNNTVVSLLEELAKQQENITDLEVPTQKKEKENVLPSNHANKQTEDQAQPLFPQKSPKQASSTVQEGEGSRKLDHIANVRADVVKSQRKTIRIGLMTSTDTISGDKATLVDSSIVIEDSDSDFNKMTKHSNESLKGNKTLEKKSGITKSTSPKKDFTTPLEASPKRVRKKSPRMMKLNEAVDSVLDSDESVSENESGENKSHGKGRIKTKVARIDSSSESEQDQVEKKREKKKKMSYDDDGSDFDEACNLNTEDFTRKDSYKEMVKKDRNPMSFTSFSVKKYDKIKRKNLQDANVCIEITSDDSVKNTLIKKKGLVKKAPVRLASEEDTEGKIHIFSISESDSERDKQRKKDLDVKVMGRKMNTIYEDVKKKKKERNSTTKRKRNDSDSDNNSKFSKRSKLKKSLKSKKCDSSSDEDSVEDSVSNDEYEEQVCSESEEDLPLMNHRKSSRTKCDEIPVSRETTPVESEHDEDDLPLKQNKTKSKQLSGSKRSKKKLSNNKSAEVVTCIDSEEDVSNCKGEKPELNNFKTEENLEIGSNSDNTDDSGSSIKQVKHSKGKRRKVKKSARSVKVKITTTVSRGDSDEEIPLSKQTISKLVDEEQIDSDQESDFVLNKHKNKSPALKCATAVRHRKNDTKMKAKNTQSKKIKKKDSGSEVEDMSSDSEDEEIPRSSVKKRNTRETFRDASTSEEEIPLSSMKKRNSRETPLDASSSDDEKPLSSRRKANNRLSPKLVPSLEQDDLPFTRKKGKRQTSKDDEKGPPSSRKKSKRQTFQEVSSSEDDSISEDEEEFPSSLKKTKSKLTPKNVCDSDDEYDIPSSKRKGKRPAPEDVSSSDEDDEEDDLSSNKKDHSNLRKTKVFSDSEEEIPQSLRRKSNSKKTFSKGVSSSEDDEELPSSERKGNSSRTSSRVETKISGDSDDMKVDVDGGDTDSDDGVNKLKSDDNSESHSNKSYSSDDEDFQRKKKISPTTKNLVSSDSDSDAALATVKKKTVQKKQQNTSKTKVSSDSDSDAALIKVKQKTAPKKQENSSKSKSNVNPFLKNLRKICHALGIIVRNTIELKGCETENDKIKRLKELLTKAGMKGQPSMKKVKDLKLLKEAAQLDTSNILSSHKGRATRSRVPCRMSPKKSVCVSPSVTKTFSRLKGIVDSEGSESD